MPAAYHAMLTSRLPGRRPKAYRSGSKPTLMDVTMQTPPLDPDVADVAPTSTLLSVYDEQHLITYLRLLDAERDGADWKEVAKIVLHIDPEREPDRARHAWETHLARARWMTEHGYRNLLRGGAALNRTP
jgi:hypothetical protein